MAHYGPVPRCSATREPALSPVRGQASTTFLLLKLPRANHAPASISTQHPGCISRGTVLEDCTPPALWLSCHTLPEEVMEKSLDSEPLWKGEAAQYAAAHGAVKTVPTVKLGSACARRQTAETGSELNESEGTESSSRNGKEHIITDLSL
ncbi:hypothetical protein SKAU_G00084980 [Synaphobranchus kaupii]|uniref:Uncharacterized protein n=1 Tax=Synaphobranchus kaupii TaxID=118154 RepID=A0A9Q1FWF4_SYNKA|nr:hypothetical protein SKAU_G00084980 [Synaphobranchus kaupii]